MSLRETGMPRKDDDSRQRADGDALYRMLPSINDLLLTETLRQPVGSRRLRLVEAARMILDCARGEIAQGLHSAESLHKRIEELPARIAEEIERNSQFSLRRVINATGVILHTNLGRAPLSRSSLDHLQEVAGGYSNLEFDLEQGERGKRDVHVEQLLLALLGEVALEDLKQTHQAIVVNNCAAASFLALHALARGKQVLVSRAELVEIGG